MTLILSRFGNSSLDFEEDFFYNKIVMLKIHGPSLAEKKYYLLKPKLEKKYDPNDYVVINPRTGRYFVGKTSLEAMKKAREIYRKGKLFLAQVGRMSILMK